MLQKRPCLFYINFEQKIETLINFTLETQIWFTFHSNVGMLEN